MTRLLQRLLKQIGYALAVWALTLQVAQAELVAYYPFDETSGTTASDASGYNNHASVLNGASWVAGRVGGALSFDGSNDGLNLNNLAGLASGNTPHTIAAWVKVNSLPANRAWILLLGNEGLGAHHWLLNSNGVSQLGSWAGNQSQPTLPTGVWKHLTLTFDGATLKAYLDGSLITTTSASFNLSGLPLTGALQHINENFLNGALDELRIYNRALSASEVASLASSGGNLAPTVSLTSPTNNATFTAPATITLSANATDADGSVTKVEFYNGASLIGSDTNGADGWSLSWASVPAGSYTLSAKAYDNAGASSLSSGISMTVNAAATGEVGLLAHWKLDESSGTSALDASGNNQTASLINTPTWISGKQSGALNFNGTGQALLRNLSGLASGNTPHTIAAWVKVNSLPANRAWLLLLGNEGTGAHHWLLNSNGVTQLGSWAGNQVTPSLSPGAWHHLALTFDGSTLTGYLNGSAIGSTAASFNLSASLSVAQAHINEAAFDGAFDELRIYNRALSASEVASLASSGGGNQAPSVSLTSPTNNATYTAPATITLSANATDADGSVAKVEFYNGASLIGTDSNGGDGWSISWASVPAGTYSLTAKAYDNAGASSLSAGINITVNAAASGEVGLLAHWKLDESSGTSALDASGNNQTASLINTPTWISGKQNGALNFNGTGQALLRNLSGLPSGNTPHTIAAWVKVNSLPANRAWLLLLGNEGVGAHHWLLNSNGVTQLGSWAGNQVTPSLSPGAWHHLALTFDGSTLTGYLNGSAIGSTAASFNLSASLSVAQAHIDEAAFDGAFDELRIYSRALSASEVASLASSPSAQPSNLYYIYADHLNTPRVITDTANTIVWRNDQADPFAASLPSEDPDGNGTTFEFNLRFPGQYYDKETGLHYNYFRDYDPAIGRYIEADPIGLAGGINTFAYVDGNPLTGFDLFGLANSGWKPLPALGNSRLPPDPLPILRDTLREMKDNNVVGDDQFFHCLATCRAKKAGSTEPTIESYTNMKEGFDFLQNVLGLYGRRKLNDKEMAADIQKDKEANAYGASCPEKQTCEQRCKPYIDAMPASSRPHMKKYLPK